MMNVYEAVTSWSVVFLIITSMVLFYQTIQDGKNVGDNRINFVYEENAVEGKSLARNLSLGKENDFDGTSVSGPDHEDHHDKILHFAIAGFPKCSTTFLRNTLLSVDEVFFGNNQNEIHLLNRNSSVRAFKKLFSNHQETTNGFKCPDLLYSATGLKNLHSYFPSTDLVISVRHPVRWFESFYNYRTRNGYHMPDPNSLIGSCQTSSSGHAAVNAHKVCTDGARFHVAMSRIGKTPMNTTEEMTLLNNTANMNTFNFSNKIFIMEIGQLSVDEQNRSSADKFVDDLETFLNLTKGVLPRLKKHEPRHHINSDLTVEEVEERLINICESKFDVLRKMLIDIGADASRWIVSYFLNSRDVYVSQREQFEELLGGWSLDPCSTIRDDDYYESEDTS